MSVNWKSGSTALTGAMLMVADMLHPGLGDSFDPLPFLDCAPGEALKLTLTGNVQVSGMAVYDAIA